MNNWPPIAELLSYGAINAQAEYDVCHAHPTFDAFWLDHSLRTPRPPDARSERYAERSRRELLGRRKPGRCARLATAIAAPIFDTIIQILSRASKLRPYVIVLDDLHRADALSLELLQ